MSRRIVVLWALLMVGVPSLGAELFYLDHDPFTEKFVGPEGPLVMSGEIATGDYDHILSKILEDENRFLTQNKIILASDGGDVTEAIKIAGLVKALFAEVIVGPQTGRCVSACFFIYAAAQQRGTEGERLIGINRPFILDSAAAPVAPSETAAVESDALRRVRIFLQENAVPSYLVEEMFRHPSNDAYWLSTNDEKNIGYRSRLLTQFLLAKCAWDDAIEHEVFAGKRPFEDLAQMWRCRASATRPEAHNALLAASKDKLQREKTAASKSAAVSPNGP